LLQAGLSPTWQSVRRPCVGFADLAFGALTGMHIIITGNPVEGFSYVGPFTTGEDAMQHGAEWLSTDWWIARLTAPATR